MNSDPNKRKGILISALVNGALVAAALLFGFTYMDPPPFLGMEVAFGLDDDGAGIPQISMQTERTVPQPPQETVPETPQQEEMVTQEEESEVVIADKPKEKPKHTPKETVKPVTSNTNPTPVQKPVEEAPKPSQTTSNALANLLSGGKGTSKGDGGGEGYKGSPDGNPASDNYSGGGAGGDGNYQLGGRAPINKPTPLYGKSNDEGYIVVRIKVDRAGNVIFAEAGARGTQITDPELYKSAEAAALKTKWQPNANAQPEQEGTIRYLFRIKG